MRKIISLAAVLVIFATFAVCAANKYDDDKNYSYVVTADNGKYYLNVKTIDVVKYRPPQYQLAGSFVHVTRDTDDKEKVSGKYITFLYDWDSKEIFGKDILGNWEKIDTAADNFEAEKNRKLADALFRAAYNMDFFGY